MPRQNSFKGMVQINGMDLDVKTSILKKNGDEIHLTPKETKLMVLLMKNVGKVVKRANQNGNRWARIIAPDMLQPNQSQLDGMFTSMV